MKRYMLLFALFMGLSSRVQAATITFDPNTITVTSGSTFTLDIIGTGFTGTEGGGAEFLFDETILQINSITIDAGVWDTFTNEGTVNNTNGDVTNIAVAAFNDPGTNFVVATVEFMTVGVGFTDLILSENPLNPWASGGSAINPTLIDGGVTVSAVPLPGAFWLFGSGILGLIGIASNRQPL
jgi:hypothetical protein